MRRHPILLLVLALAVLAPSGVWAYHHGAWFTPDGNAIRRQIDASVYANHEFDYPPARYDRYTIPAALIRSQRARAFALSRRLYTGRLLLFWLQTYRRIISRQSYSSSLAHTLVWRVLSIQHDTLSLVPGSSTAEAEVVTTEESSLGQVSTWRNHYHLVRIGGLWKIGGFDTSCLDGCP
jgi:hypothetical protein